MDIDQAIKQINDGFEVLNSYFAEGDRLLRYVGIDNPLNIDDPWMCSGQGLEIRFSDSDTKIETKNDFVYCNEIIGQLYVKEKYSAAYVNNGCGDQYWMILKNSNRRLDLE